MALTKSSAFSPASLRQRLRLRAQGGRLTGRQSVAPGTQAGLGAKGPPSCAVGVTPKIWLNLLTIIEALCGQSCAGGGGGSGGLCRRSLVDEY